MENSGIQKCRKYFIFKIQDLVNNSYHTLEEKRQESLLKYIEVCIDTYDELSMSLDQSKLNRSYEGLLEGLDAQLQKHPFRLLDLYKDDFSNHVLYQKLFGQFLNHLHIFHLFSFLLRCAEWYLCNLPSATWGWRWLRKPRCFSLSCRTIREE